MNFTLHPLVFVAIAALSGLATAQAQDSGKTSTSPRFDVFEYRVEGNSVLDDEAIETALLPYLGEGKSFADLEAARSALESSYNKAGWLTVSVSIPEQQIDAGEVTLKVLEGAIGKVRVRGAAYNLSSGIRAAIPEFAEGNVPNFESVQQQIAAASRPDLRITPVMKAGSAPGTVDVGIEVDDDPPIHGNVEFNNRQSPNTTWQRLSASVSYDNLWQSRHSITGTAQWSPLDLDEVSQYGLTYVMPFRRGAFALYGVRSRNNYGTIAGAPGLGVTGNSDIVGLRYVMPMPGLNDYSHSLAAGFDYKDVKQWVKLAGSPDSASPIRYAPLTATYTGNLIGASSTTTMEMGAVLGVRGFLGDDDTAFAAKREGASGSFSVLKIGFEHNQSFSGWGVRGRLDLQLASDPLISNEQFSAGGADSVRGYLEGEEFGDDALRLSLQLSTPSISLAGRGSSWKLAGVAFYEGVQLHTQKARYPTPAYKLIRGTGFGMRLKGPKDTALELDVAQAQDDAATTHAGDYRIHGRFSVAF